MGRRLAKLNLFSLVEEAKRVFGTGSTGQPIIMVPENKHYSWKKGASLIGLDEECCWPVALDHHGVLDPNDLEKKLERARQQHRPVLMVVSVVGSTELGFIDPIHKVQKILRACELNKIFYWHHVDAAYGGFLRTVLNAKPKVFGEYGTLALGAMKAATSVTVDPHKLGYIPFSCGAFLVGDIQNYWVRTYDSPYMENKQNRGRFTLEGSRAATGPVATWMSAKSIGFNGQGLGRILSRTIESRRIFEKNMAKIPLIRVVGDGWQDSPATNILCFAVARENEPLSQTNKHTRRMYEAFSYEARSDYTVSKTTLRSPGCDAFIDKFVGSWNGKKDTEELDLVRMTLMNPFLRSKEMKTDFISDFSRQLRNFLKTL
jgi:glutamate/tyrosine decarboxylase-like PLP-dependent enzyme